MHAHAIAQVEPPDTGIHMIWSGPYQWVYSQTGWSIQRRLFNEQDEGIECQELDPAAIQELRTVRELIWPFGALLLREGLWPTLMQQIPRQAGPSCDVFTLELDTPRRRVQVRVRAQNSFAFALREGKVVDSHGPTPGVITFELRGLDIDTVVVYAIDPGLLRLCVFSELIVEEESWEGVPFIVKNLQIPLAELMPGLGSPVDEFAEGKTRLLVGETLDEEEFKRLAAALRPGLKEAGPPRPIDQVLLLREEPDENFEELVAFDPLRILVSHPKWRRVLGFGWFDEDPSLVVGETYEYRITGELPAQDLADTVYGFHSVPSQTLLPSFFAIGDMRLRLPVPVTVQRSPGTPLSGLQKLSRRGIPIRERQNPWWQVPALDDFSLVINLADPASSVILELHEEHALEWTAVSPPLLGVEASGVVPPGPNPRLNFPAPMEEIRLRGEGFLFAVRLPAGPEGPQLISAVLPPVTLENTPRPDPPLLAHIENLQQPLPQPGPQDIPPAIPPRRPALGFEVTWRPAVHEGLPIWPIDAPAAPPLDAALYQIEQRQVSEGGDTLVDWTPLLTEENWITGDRGEGTQPQRVGPGVDLLAVYPETPQGGSGSALDLFWRDVFDFEEGGNVVLRALPEPGTHHRYRVRAVDPVGRPSLTWTETNQLRLEKHLPPPLPAGPDLTPIDPAAPPRPVGVHAHLLVKDAPGLTAEDLVTLGGDDNIIVLQWGWHDQQREQDAFAREFRIYASQRPLDLIPGKILTVVPAALGVYEVTIELERAVTADAAQGLSLDAPYPFRIYTHTAGTTILATVGTRVPKADGTFQEPLVGAVSFYVRLTPDLTRPPMWSRVEVQPITAATQYEAILRNRLVLTEDNLRDGIWVGVSAADDQSYVADQLATADPRPGNESAIVPVLCEGRYQRRPEFSVPPKLDPVDVLLTPEPAGEAVKFDLDLTPFFDSSGFGPGEKMRPERIAADTIFSSYFVAPNNRVMARAIDPRDNGEVDEEVLIPNPDDRTAIIDALNGTRVDALADQYVVFLAGSHPYRDRLFEAALLDPAPVGPFAEALPPVGERFVYRIRKANAADLLSAGGAMAEVVVRVPSLSGGAPPEKAPAQAGDTPQMLRLQIGPDPLVDQLLTFSQVVSAEEDLAGTFPGEAQLVRVPNRPDLYPHDGIRLRAPEGTFLSPAVKSLSDADVTVTANGVRQVALTFSTDAGQRLRVWACTITGDNAPSRLRGPFSVQMPPPPLPVPVLTAAAVPPDVQFTWTWPAIDDFFESEQLEVVLERSADGFTWTRFSPLMAADSTSFSYSPPAGSWEYRIVVIHVNGGKERGDPIGPV